MIAVVERANIEPLVKNGVRLAERFVAKGRDGKTDIWGIICRPRDFDPSKQYPMVTYFYESLSDGLHNYVTPAGRNVVNGQVYASLQKANRLSEIERSITEDKVFDWLLAQNTVE